MGKPNSPFPVAPGKHLGADRAVNWDGKTETGEAVASGTYFYQIETDNYTETCTLV